jgi:hypothetical protein
MIQVYEHLAGRWRAVVKLRSHPRYQEFDSWMQHNNQDCDYVYRFNNGDPYWEVSGGPDQQELLMMMALRWTDE